MASETERCDPEKEAVIDKAKELAANIKAINAFFADKPRNHERDEWFDPDDGAEIPAGAVALITKSLQTYFKTKKWYNGGTIPPELLFTANNYRLINNVSMLDAVEMAYENIKRQKSFARTRYAKNADIALTLKVIRGCER